MPQHKRGPWSQAEDSFLLSLVNLHGAHNWVRISQAIQTRSPKQCRERFHQNLKPNLNHDPITPEEGVLIEQMVAEMGKRWAEIARRLRGRSDNAVKNWWNGGMNRRRRSNQQRRAEVDLRQQSNGHSVPIQSRPLAAQHQHSLPPGFTHVQQQFFAHPMYAPGHGGMPHQMRLPSNGPPLRPNGLVETPLPSPSAYSQLSADGAPSLVSDTSSMSARSPYNGGSPIELPPLAGARSERRQSAAPVLQLGVPGSFVQEQDFQMSMHRFGDDGKRMLQEPFMPMQPYPAPTQYLPSQLRHSMPFQSNGHQIYAMQNSLSQKNMLPSQSTPVAPAMQLPSITNVGATQGYAGPHVDMAQVRCTPVPSAPTPEGSPKDKMSLSNLTL